MKMARCAARRRKGKHWGVTNKEIEIYTFGMRRALFYNFHGNGYFTYPTCMEYFHWSK
jgi:hypothetical protein